VDGSLEAALKQVGDVESSRQKAVVADGLADAAQGASKDGNAAVADGLRKASKEAAAKPADEAAKKPSKEAVAEGLSQAAKAASQEGNAAIADGLRKASKGAVVKSAGESEHTDRGREIAETFTDLPGLGNDEWEGFPADVCPADLPDLVKHHSIMAAVLKKDKEVYTTLKDSKTPGGVPLARCIKTGIDNLGHPMIKSVGAIAGDAECYDTFRTLFDPILSKWHGAVAESDTHPTDMDIRKISVAPLESAATDGERYVMSCQIRARRNLRGIAMPPAAQREGRREVERVLVKGLSRLPDELQGEYHPLRGSTSYAPRPGGMTVEGQARLEAQGLLFSQPDAPLLLASGTGRHWPDARGIFATGNGQLAAWLNDEDHLQLIAGCDKGDLRGAFACFCAADEALSSALKEDGHEFAHSSRLGYLSTCPSNVGTALLAEVVVKLPLLSAKFSKSDFRSFCKRLKLRSRAAGGTSELGTWEIANEERLGSSEVDQVNGVLEGVRALVAAEQKLARGEGEELKLADISPTAPQLQG
jgi:creatine kinase